MRSERRLVCGGEKDGDVGLYELSYVLPSSRRCSLSWRTLAQSCSVKWPYVSWQKRSIGERCRSHSNQILPGRICSSPGFAVQTLLQSLSQFGVRCCNPFIIKRCGVLFMFYVCSKGSDGSGVRRARYKSIRIGQYKSAFDLYRGGAGARCRPYLTPHRLIQ